VKKLGSLSLLLVLAVPLPAAADADAILGLWQTAPTDKGYAHVEITRQDGLYGGRVVWLSEPDFPPGDPEEGQPKADRFNPEPELRGRPILGLSLMQGFRNVGARVWKGGRIYDPENGQTYKCSMKLRADGTLRVRGFIGISLLGRTTTWVRAQRLRAGR
jgi:uncharacterized protein (DUF2147 family)